MDLQEALSSKFNKNKQYPKKKENKKPKKIKPNLGWLFYKDYFKDLDFDNLEQESIKIKQKIDKILEYNSNNFKKINIPNTLKFNLITTYPGLLLGSGYLHELPSIEGQAILGFDFDYTTGLPIIRGSSIKGVIKSAFEYKEFIEELEPKIKNIDFEEFKNNIFENNDIFFDAVVVNVGDDGLLSDDYITPHKDELKNPIPLRFLKVSPNVEFEFSFILNDFENITKDDKKKLFKKIITELGLGAKTNVGYGKLI